MRYYFVLFWIRPNSDWKLTFWNCCQPATPQPHATYLRMSQCLSKHIHRVTQYTWIFGRKNSGAAWSCRSLRQARMTIKSLTSKVKLPRLRVNWNGWFYSLVWATRTNSTWFPLGFTSRIHLWSLLLIYCSFSARLLLIYCERIFGNRGQVASARIFEKCAEMSRKRYSSIKLANVITIRALLAGNAQENTKLLSSKDVTFYVSFMTSSILPGLAQLDEAGSLRCAESYPWLGHAF